MKIKTTQELFDQAETLKEDLWEHMRVNKNEHKGIKESMNELLDLIEELDL